MEIESFYKSSRQAHLLEEIKKCDWQAGKLLYDLINENRFFELIGSTSELLLLVDDDKLVSFCTFAQKDEIYTEEYSPWVGFVYTFPEYRGRRYFGRLLQKAEALAKEQGKTKLYVSTDHIGLYEKYGFEYLTQMKSIYGDMARVYVKDILKRKE